MWRMLFIGLLYHGHLFFFRTSLSSCLRSRRTRGRCGSSRRRGVRHGRAGRRADARTCPCPRSARGTATGGPRGVSETPHRFRSLLLGARRAAQFGTVVSDATAPPSPHATVVNDQQGDRVAVVDGHELRPHAPRFRLGARDTIDSACAREAYGIPHAAYSQHLHFLTE